jgi:hypothetical protein
LPETKEEYFQRLKKTSRVNLAPAAIFWRRCRGGSRRLLRGEFSHAHPLLCFIVLLYFIYFTCIILYQKPKKNRILGSCYFFTFSLLC